MSMNILRMNITRSVTTSSSRFMSKLSRKTIAKSAIHSLFNSNLILPAEDISDFFGHALFNSLCISIFRHTIFFDNPVTFREIESAYASPHGFGSKAGYWIPLRFSRQGVSSCYFVNTEPEHITFILVNYAFLLFQILQI